MMVIYKTRLFLLAGCVVSTAYFSTAIKLAQSLPNSSLRAISSAGISAEELSNLGSDTALKNEKFQLALVQLRKDVNLSTSKLLEAPIDN